MTRRPAFTLVELVLSLALASIVLMGLTSAIVLAARALPDANDEATLGLTLDGGAALARLTGEVRYAIHFGELTGRAVTFSVADRDGDGYPERIRYHWSGKPGDPLYRSYNGGEDVAILDAVDALTFTTETGSESVSYTGADIKSPETTLASFFTSSGQTDTRVEYSKAYAQHFQPTLPSGALRWQASRVFVAMRYRAPTDGTMRAALYRTSNNKPTGAELAGVNVGESALLSSFNWLQLTFSDAPIANPGDVLTFTLAQTGGNNEVGDVLYASSGSSVPGYHEGANGSWSYRSGRTLLHYVYGHYWTPGVTRTLTFARHHRFTLAVTLTGGAAAPLRAGCNLDNRPYADAKFWRLTFDEPDPTLTDANADGRADWAVRGGGSFNTGQVSGGVWNCNQRLDSKPDDTFTAPTVIDLRLRSTVADQEGAGFWINADWGAGSSNAGIYARLVGGSNSQTLNFYMEIPGPDAIVKQVSLPAGMVDVRLIVDPIHDEAALFAGGVHQGTFSLLFENDANDTPNVTLECTQSGATFDEVTVVVGGSY